MSRIWTACQTRFVKDEKGASMMEYAFLIALIALVVIAGALFLGTQISDRLSEVGATLQDT
jgi:Flp pilus assembly pilin Flp